MWKKPTLCNQNFEMKRDNILVCSSNQKKFDHSSFTQNSKEFANIRYE